MSNTIFEEIGGFEAIIAAVDIFYEKIMNDVTLAPFFEKLSMDKQQDKMVSFMAWAFGGPDEYKGKDLRTAHMHLVRDQGLNESHFNRVVEHLVATLKELDVAQPLIDQVVALVASTIDEVLGR